MNKSILAAIIATPALAVGTGVAGYQLGEHLGTDIKPVQEQQAQANQVEPINDGYATVIATRPLTETYTINEPRRECTKVPVHKTVKQDAPYGGKATYAIGGAIIGGLIGNQFGDGRGKDIGTAAGAILGGSVGYDQAKRRETKRVVTTYKDQCKTVNYSRTATRNKGYEVTYQYAGQVYTTTMDQPPMSRFPVQTQITPAPYPAHAVSAQQLRYHAPGQGT